MRRVPWPCPPVFLMCLRWVVPRCEGAHRAAPGAAGVLPPRGYPYMQNAIARTVLQQVGQTAQITADSGGTGRPQAFPMAGAAVAAAGEADHAHPGSSGGPHAGQAVLDHDTARGCHSHPLRGEQEQIGGGLAAGYLSGTEHVRIEMVQQPRQRQRMSQPLRRTAGGNAASRAAGPAGRPRSPASAAIPRRTLRPLFDAGCRQTPAAGQAACGRDALPGPQAWSPC